MPSCAACAFAALRSRPVKVYMRSLRARHPNRGIHAREEAFVAPPARHSGGEAHPGPARARRFDPLGTARPGDADPRPVRGVPAFARIRTARPGARRLLPAQDQGAAAAVRIRHPGHRQAVARPIRMVRPRAPCGARRRERADHQGAARRARARSRCPRTSARSTTSSRSSTGASASATRPTPACRRCSATTAWSSSSASSAITC